MFVLSNSVLSNKSNAKLILQNQTGKDFKVPENLKIHLAKKKKT